MKTTTPVLAAALALAASASAQDPEEAAPSPNEIVATAPPEAWVAIAPEDLLVMDLAPDAEGNPRRVIIQLIPAPFSQGWVENIRSLAQQHWWDGTNVYRVQDNYVVQWGGGAVEKEEPEDLKLMGEDEYLAPTSSAELGGFAYLMEDQEGLDLPIDRFVEGDPYATVVTFENGWPIGMSAAGKWPLHCYGMIGVARGMPPDTGGGTELYTVIGHAPRHLDRNLALAGRVIEGMEHLSSLPRGKGPLGFYDDDEADKRVPILSVRLASELEEFPAPVFEYMDTAKTSFARYADARTHRREPFFVQTHDRADICNIPVPVRRVPTE